MLSLQYTRYIWITGSKNRIYNLTEKHLAPASVFSPCIGIINQMVREPTLEWGEITKIKICEQPWLKKCAPIKQKSKGSEWTKPDPGDQWQTEM